MSSGSQTSRGRGRGFNVNSAHRNSNGNYGNRGGSEYQVPRNNNQNRNNNNENRNNNSEIRNKTDPSLISSQNVQWNYDKSKIGLVKPEFVKRKEHLTDKFGRKIKLMTNHFSFRFASEVNIYLYNFSWLYKEADEEKPKTKKLLRDDCYKLFDSVMSQYSSYFKNTSVGYDGNANVYLPYQLEQEFNDLLVSNVELDGKSYDFNVFLKFTKKLPLSVLSEYYAGSGTNDVNSLMETIQALHIILKFPSRNNMISLGRLAMFPIDGERYYLSNWMQLALGHRKSIRFSEIGLTLVVDRASAAFLKSGNGVDFMKSVIDLKEESPDTFRPNPYQIKLLAGAFVHVKISTNHLGFTKKYVVKNISETAADQETFKLNENGVERAVTVAEYFREKYQVKLKYPTLPCIITTNGSKIPMEVCEVICNQSSQQCKKSLSAGEKAKMIREAVKPPDERFTCLLQAHQQLRQEVYETDIMKDFELNIDLKPIGVEGIVLEAPKLRFSQKELSPINGSWDLRNKIFFRTKTFNKFGIINFCAHLKEVVHFKENFINKASEMKMTNKKDCQARIFDITNFMEKKKKDIADSITEMLKQMKYRHFAFALCIFPDQKNKDIYNITKRIADTVVHFPTQGVILKIVQDAKPQTIANILAKINKKLGGVNVILKEDEKPVLLKKIMIIGADVTHPGEADELLSSVAASVSTYDSDHTMFYPSVRVQPKKNAEKKIVEVIKDFKSMVNQHLDNYLANNKCLPHKILYLRDGVSDGQYAKVHDEEVVHLKNPCEGYKPKVTAVIISKRILTRARPVDSRDGVGNNCNVPPGTTIDSIITHPSDLDYFQYGHKGIKGTSRPCHYYMVHDDNNLTTDQMAKISYYLCHIFERATSSTSAPAPVMHAHNLAFKARQWISSMNLKCDLRGLKGDERFKAEENIAEELNTLYSNINVDYARSSMFYI